MRAFIEVPPIKYMIVDVTTLEHIAVVKVAYSREAIMWGRLYKAQGRKVLGLVIAGKSFSSLGREQVQYLYWNHCRLTPPDDFGELVKLCFEEINKISVSETTVEALETELEALQPNLGSANKSAQRAPKDPSAPKPDPKPTSTCGIIWTICNEQFAKAGNKLPDRKTIMDLCQAEEINLATAGVQYAKWKKSKGLG